MTSCVNGEGEVVPDSRCTLGRPKTREICDMGSCARGWYYTRWSKDVSAGSVGNEGPMADVRETDRMSGVSDREPVADKRERERARASMRIFNVYHVLFCYDAAAFTGVWEQD